MATRGGAGGKLPDCVVSRLRIGDCYFLICRGIAGGDKVDVGGPGVLKSARSSMLQNRNVEIWMERSERTVEASGRIS